MKYSFVGNAGKFFGMALVGTIIVSHQATAGFFDSHDQGNNDMVSSSGDWEAIPVAEWAKASPALADGFGFGIDVEKSLFIVPGHDSFEIAKVKTCANPMPAGGADGIWGVQSGPECIIVNVKKSDDFDTCSAVDREILMLNHSDSTGGKRRGEVKGVFIKYPKWFARKLTCTVVVARLRPGYFTTSPDHRSSGSARVDGSGKDYQNNQNGYVTAVLGANTAALKNLFSVSTVTLLGTSGGANLALLEAALFPSSLRGVYGYEPSCDFVGWRKDKQYNKSASLNPIDYLASIPPTMPIQLVAGGQSKVIKSKFIESCYTKGKQLDLDIAYTVLDDQKHSMSWNANIALFQAFMRRVHAAAAEQTASN